eukprot:sb/3465049/
MLCCIPSWLIGLVILVGLLVSLKKKKTERAYAKRLQEVLDRANSWCDSPIEEFDPLTTVTVERVEDMKRRLRDRIVDRSLQGPSCYGTPFSYVDKVADYFTEKCTFSTITDTLTGFNHYKTVIGDVTLHFVHMKGEDSKKHQPILLLHGWPSTIVEFHKSIPLLLKQGYTVVAPSLPGLGFTAAPAVPGVSPMVIAAVYSTLMKRLGYTKYVVHGGDWGSIIGQLLTTMYPEQVIGLHITMNRVSTGKYVTIATYRMYKQMAYFHAQSVMGDSIGFGYTDSPTGLIGWIGTCFSLASSPRDPQSTIERTLDEGVELFGMDNICAMLAVFWCTRTAQVSMRIYNEFYWRDMGFYKASYIPNVPVAVSNFPNEILHVTKFVSGASFGNIAQFNYHGTGGHFCHIDNTAGVVADLTTFIERI